MSRKIFSKIVGGVYKNKKILLPSLQTTRSTKTILRESLFNTLQFDIIDKIFIEAFGGSGSMGLEAISRGAKSAYFIEKDKTCFKILNENCNNIAPEKTYRILDDTFNYIPKLLDTIGDTSNTILYLDPPFDIRDGFDDIYNKLILLIENISNRDFFLVVIEHNSSVKFKDKIGNFKLLKNKKFGKTTISYFADTIDLTIQDKV